jgi:hypothetical protein
MRDNLPIHNSNQEAVMKRAQSILIALALLMGYQVVWAQIPSTMSYQGVLHDGSGGAVADSLYAITFNLYDISTGGTPLWTEVQDVQVKGGIFSVILGNVTTLNLPFDVSYWLGVTVEGSPEFSPRRELTASPYSLNAKSIEAGAVTESALADSSVTSGKIANDAVGSSEIAGGTVVRSLNSLTDDVTLAPGPNVAISVSGDTLTIGATSVGDTDWTVSGNDMYSSVSGNVGIGTASPSVKLDVSGGINTDSDYNIGGNAVLSTLGTDNLLVGVGAGANNTTGNNNTFLGHMAGFSNTTGYANTFVGRDAGNANTTGDFNTFVGLSAGFSNTTGGNNTFVGRQAGNSNITGHSNTFLGHQAGRANTTGVNNTFVGQSAGTSNTTGQYNIFLGTQAGYANTTGVNNTFVGLQAGNFNTTGSSNTFLGYRAGYLNTTGFSNTFVGYTAGNSNTTGNSNTFVGLEAGYSNTTGNSNTSVGRYAGYSNTTGAYNTFLGYQAAYNNTTGARNIFIGFQAGFNETGSNKLYIANGQNDADVLVYGDFATDRVGIATTTPGYTLDVAGEAHAREVGKDSWRVIRVEWSV